MRFSFVLVAGPRRHLSLGGDQSGSSRPTETTCYGSGLISCVLDAADAGGRPRPAGRLRNRNRGRRRRLYISDL